MNDFVFVRKDHPFAGTTMATYISVYQSGDVQVLISEPDHENIDPEERDSIDGAPCSITISDGKMMSHGGWMVTNKVHEKSDKNAYVLIRPTVGPMSFFETPLHRAIEDIDEHEDNKYGEFKRAFLWAEKWLEEHYPGYTILTNKMRERKSHP